MKEYATRNEMLIDLIPVSGNIAEVGVFKGEFSRFILDTLRPKSLHLFDLFTGRVGSGDQDGNNFSYVDLSVVLKDISSWNDPRVIINKGDSSHELSRLEDNTFDAIYLDGDHSYEGCKKDLDVAIRKIKPGGWIMGHDYQMNMAKARTFYNFGVKRAVDEFCKTFNQEIVARAMDGCVSFAIRVRK